MDDRRFDALAKLAATGMNRRAVLKAILGLGGAALAGGAQHAPDSEAARRPTPTPKPKKCPGVQVPCGNDCCCPAGSDKCGSDCCPTGQAVCCDNACCFGTCQGEEICCPGTTVWCEAEGGCCPEGSTCCDGLGCLEPGLCCTDADCSAYADPETCAPGVCTEPRVCATGPGCGAGETCCPGVGCLSEDQCCTSEECEPGTFCDPGSHTCLCEPSCCFCGVDDGCEGICGCPAGFECLGNGCFSACAGGACTESCEDCACASPFDTPAASYCVSLQFPGGECTSDEDCGLGAFCAEHPESGGLECLYPCCFFESNCGIS